MSMQVDHAGEFGILVSTVICAAMFSFKLADRCLSRLHDSMGLFAGISAITLVRCFEPYLYTTTVTAYYILLAALFYPSAPVTAECDDEEKAEGTTTHPETISEKKHDNHHAMVSLKRTKAAFQKLRTVIIIKTK